MKTSIPVTRRGFLELGGLGLVGLALPELLKAEGQERPSPRTKPIAKSCLLFFLEGGPAHQDLWDMKPDAPLEYRGEFRPIETSAPDIQVCEHLPLLAKNMHHVALVRSVRHSVNDHNAGAYYALTGRSPFEGSELIRSPSQRIFPTYGPVLAKFRPSGKPLPDFVHIPEVLSNLGFDLPGQFAGFLGSGLDPYISGDPSLRAYEAPTLSLRPDVSPRKFRRRQELRRKVLDRVLGQLGEHDAFRQMEKHYQRAFELLGSTEARRAFDLSQEPEAMRERYGTELNTVPVKPDRGKMARQFGGLPHLGQSMLLGRRLIEAGVRLVTVCTGRRFCQAWDTHRENFPLLKTSLLPMADRAFSALLEDMSQRGLLEDTLVVAMGEFGRTPKVGQITSDAGASKSGRDHWPNCYTVLFAGAGIKGGYVHGASDKYAAFPTDKPLGPEDIAATIYHCLGLDPKQEMVDSFGRPHVLALGEPITEIIA